MAIDERPGTLHWVDHFGVPTNDLDRWLQWVADVLGTTEAWHDTDNTPGPRFAAFRNLGTAHIIGFTTTDPIPENGGLGKGAPRYGFYIKAEDIDNHLRRLDELNVPHSEAIRTSAEGDPGTVIYFEDPDHNQFEFWAPDHLPEGAMEKASKFGVGRISHGVYESRDLDRTAAFYNRYCALDPMQSADIPNDTLVLPLAAGGRLIFKKVDKLDVRTGGSTLWRGVHNGFIIRAEDFIPSYERVWGELDEWDYDQRRDGKLEIDPGDLPARTGQHGSEAGRRWKAMYGRGDQIYDPDTNSFHFVGGTSDRPTLATYESQYMEDYVAELMKNKPGN